MSDFFHKIDSVLGYCQHCGQATVVGRFTIRDWKHEFTLCSRCLNQMATFANVQP